MYSPLNHNSFMARPLFRMGEVLSERDTRNYDFQEVFLEIYSFFAERKPYRTIRDVDNLITHLDKKFDFPYDEDLSDEKGKEERLEDLRDEFETLLEDYQEVIEGSVDDPKLDEFMIDWLYNVTMCIEAFKEALNLFETKVRRIRRVTHRIQENLLNHFLDVTKVFFLVFYRIVEQYYMITNNIEMNIEAEKKYLLNDLVYMQNIHRKFIYKVEKYTF